MSSLRQFRYKKETLKNGSDTEAASSKLVPGRKRIRAPASDSSSDEGGHTSKKPAESVSPTVQLSADDKEVRVRKVLSTEPDYDAERVQQALAKYDWNVDRTLKYLRERKKSGPTAAAAAASASSSSSPTSSKSSQKHSSNGNSRSPSTVSGGSSAAADANRQQSHHRHHHHHQQRKSHSPKEHKHTQPRSNTNSPPDAATLAPPTKPARRHSGSADEQSDGGAGDGYRKTKKSVYDSEDDDSEDDRPKRQTYHMSGERQKVFDFINTSRPMDFHPIRSVSQKKIDILLEMRPFRDWRDIVVRIGAHKGISCDLLNACQEYLTRRNNLTRIMSKCTRMVDRLERAVADGGGITKQPSLLGAEFQLADYQMIGLNWLAVMHQEDMNGILADEMGLGKTIQVISFLAWLKETGRSKATHLVVVPSSTLENWANELAKWCPSLVVSKYYGSIEERRQMRFRFAKGGLSNVDVLLTTYHIVGSTPEERKMFRVTKIHYVVFDEAHMLKNMTSLRYTNLIRINAARRLLLTGTPLQNNLLELMSLLCFVMPSMFASNTDDIKALFQKSKYVQTADMAAEPESSFEQSQIEQAKRIMRPFVLRRLKNVVLNSLPAKSVHTVMVPMAAAQAELYHSMVQDHSSETGIVRASHELSGMTIMMDMRKLANHPLLLRYYYTDKMLMRIAERLSTHPFWKKNPHPPYIFEELAMMSDFQVQQLLEKYDVKTIAGEIQNIPDAEIVASGKFQQLDELLSRMKRDGHRVLIFSQFTMMLDVLERYLDIREYGFLRLDGQTAVTERQELRRAGHQFDGGRHGDHTRH